MLTRAASTASRGSPCPPGTGGAGGSPLALEADDWISRPGVSGDLFARPPAGGVFAAWNGSRGVWETRRCPAWASIPITVPSVPAGELPPGRGPRRSKAGGRAALGYCPRPCPWRRGEGRPRWHGPLILLGQPERLESGWWDAGEAGAMGTPAATTCRPQPPRQWFWVFRVTGAGWSLQGFSDSSRSGQSLPATCLAALVATSPAPGPLDQAWICSAALPLKNCRWRPGIALQGLHVEDGIVACPAGALILPARGPDWRSPGHLGRMGMEGLGLGRRLHVMDGE